MPNWDAYKEAERRGILTDDKQVAYNEAKRRGLVPGFDMATTDDSSPPRVAEIRTGEKPSFLDRAISGVFGESSAALSAKADNSIFYAKEFNIRPSQAYELHDQISKELGGKRMPSTVELAMVPMTAGILVGMMTHPLMTASALAMFEGLSEAESAVISFVQGEEYKAFQRKALVDLLPDDVNSTTELAVEAVDLLWKGIATAGGLHAGKLQLEYVKTVMEGHKLPKLYIDRADLAQVKQTRGTRSYIDKMETTEDGVIIADPSRGPIPQELQPIAKLDPRQQSRIDIEALADTERLGKVEVETLTDAPFNQGSVETGKPVRFNYDRSTKNKVSEKDFGQDIEPSGKFVSAASGKKAIEGVESGIVQLDNPLVLEHKTTRREGWKTDLSNMFGGKKGRELTEAIQEAGHDGVVTIDKGRISESVILKDSAVKTKIEATKAPEAEGKALDLERQSAEAAIFDIETNARQSSKFVDQESGQELPRTLSANKLAQAWYVDAGYTAKSVVAALKKVVSGKKPGKLQENIIRDWRSNEDAIMARFGPEVIESKVTAETKLADNIKSLEATEPSSFLVDAPLTTIGEAPTRVVDTRRPSFSASSPEPSAKRKTFEPLTKAAQVVGKEAKTLRKQIGNMADEYLGAISTRLGNIDPALKSRLRKFEFETATKRAKRVRESLPLMEKVKAMSKADKKVFDLARKNADGTKINEIVKREGLEKEYKAVRDLLDKLHKEAIEVGIDVGFIKDFHPRVLKDKEGFLEKMRGQEDWPLIEKAIQEQETKLGRYLEQDEKADLINSLLRGYRRGAITLSKPSELKAREIDKIDAELDKFYMDSDAALVNYISSVTEAIEARRLFGKRAKGSDRGDMRDTIGGFVSDLLHEGKIKPQHEHTIKDILSSRFNQVGTRGIVGVYKNLSYIDTMGNSISAITQIGDTAWALYKGGIPRTLSSLKDAIKKKSLVTREDIGIEQISAEFADTSKTANAVGRIFDMVGLSRIDAIGKETLINAEYKTLLNRSKTPEGRKLLEQELKPVFEGETKALIEDIKAGRITENVKLHLFNTLSDFQPISLSEMPQKYLTGGNGRIFYMLKSFTLKQFDIYRREVFQQIAKPETRVKGIKNMVKLSAAFVAANASADVVKDLVLGRPITLEDKAVDNMLRLFGISKFVTWKAREEGVGSALVRQISPPFKFIDSLSKDINMAGDEKGLETVGSIPVGGKLYYWWFGKGRDKVERRKSSKVAN